MAGRGNWLAQRTAARMKAPLDSDQLAAPAALPDPVNPLASAAPGFVWRQRSNDGHEVGVRGEPGLLVTRPLWETANRTPAGRSG